MKNLSIAVNIILIIAVAYLYIDKFTGSDSESLTAEISNVNNTDLSIVYINIDTLLRQYNYYDEVSTTLEERRGKLEIEYTRRAEALQGQIEDYQRTMTNMTVAQAQAIEEDLSRKQQDLLQYRESIRQELLRDEAEITQKLYDRVSSFLKSYAEDKGLHFVLTYSAGSNLLYANNELEITNDVIEGLNDEYTDRDNEVTTDSTTTN